MLPRQTAACFLSATQILKHKGYTEQCILSHKTDNVGIFKDKKQHYHPHFVLRVKGNCPPGLHFKLFYTTIVYGGNNYLIVLTLKAILRHIQTCLRHFVLINEMF